MKTSTDLGAYLRVPKNLTDKKIYSKVTSN